MKTRKEKILNLIYQRHPQLHYEHEREYLATLINNLVDKEINRAPKLSDEFLDECDARAHSADPLHADYVINDLRSKINNLTNHIRKIQKNNEKS